MPNDRPPELLSRAELADLFGLHWRDVPKRFGPPDAVIRWSDSRSIPGWSDARIELLANGRQCPPVDEPSKYYSLRQCASLLNTSCKKAQGLLGNPDAVFVCLAREYPVWQHHNVLAAWRIVDESRLSGDRSFDVRAYKRKPKPRRLATFIRRPPPASRVRFVPAIHRWADPRDVAACRVRKA